MKISKNELDVDFIGGGKALTKEEELAISAFIKTRKLKAATPKIRKTRERVKKATV